MFKNPDWDYKTLNYDSDIAIADTVDNGTNNATDPNLKTYFEHGGKLLQYHGWNDQLIAPGNTVNYYRSVLDKMGGAAKTADSVRLFMMPGVGHCGGGEGPSLPDPMPALEQWVEQGKAPEQIQATRLANYGEIDRTRPLCPYPQVAKYKGSGSTDDAANFVCAMP